jgi:hypothetical protein
MAAPLAICTKEEQRSEGVKPIEINRQMNVLYGDACLSLWQVYRWTKKFMNSISSVTDSPRPGQAHRVVTPEAIAAVEETVKENRRVAVNHATLQPKLGSFPVCSDSKLNTKATDPLRI